MKNTAPQWKHAKRVLAVRLDTLGDVLMTTPAIRALKQAETGRPRHITLLTSSAGAAVGPLIPVVDDVIVYDAPWIKPTPPRADSFHEYEMVERLRREQFDAAIIFTVYSQNPLPAAFLTYLAGIPLRLAHCHENPYQLLTDWVSDPEPAQFIRHEVRRHLDLVATVGFRAASTSLSLSAPPRAIVRAGTLLDSAGIDRTQPWVVVHPGVSAPSRQYPPERFAEVAEMLRTDHGVQVVFTGSGAEAELIAGIQSMMSAPSVSLANCLALDELAALLKLSPLLVANNTGPVHVAAAVGTPVVDLYALTNPQHAPWGVPHRLLFHDVPCKFCYRSVCPEGHHNCLRLVEPAAVVAAALELLAAARLGAPFQADVRSLTEVMR